MSDASYIVRKGHLVLELRGVFEYPHFNSFTATRMTCAKACACAGAFGGEVVPVESLEPHGLAMPKPAREAETLPPPPPFGAWPKMSG